jgi:hypothetical protein
VELPKQHGSMAQISVVLVPCSQVLEPVLSNVSILVLIEALLMMPKNGRIRSFFAQFARRRIKIKLC